MEAFRDRVSFSFTLSSSMSLALQSVDIYVCIGEETVDSVKDVIQ